MNNEWAEKNGKSTVPCMALWGGKSFADEQTAQSMAEQYYQGVQCDFVEGSGHWIAEEKPSVFVEKVLKWVERN